MGKPGNRTLILGVGNDILMDDGIGPVIVKDLEKEFPGCGVDFITVNLGGLEIFELIKDYEQVIIIDAIKTSSPPGSIFYLTLSDFVETCHLSSFHDISFIEAIQLGEKIGYEMPETGIIAIEIVEDMIFGNSFSPELEERYNDIYSEIRRYLEPVLRLSMKVRLTATGRQSTPKYTTYVP